MLDTKYLFIGHDAHRTGAPILLLNFLKWLRDKRPDIQFDVLLIEGGPLEEEYRSLANTTVLSRHRRTSRKILDRLRRIVIPKAKNALPKTSVLKENYFTVIGNTILSLPLLEHFSERNSRTILWMHEMESVIRDFYDLRDFRTLTNKVDQIIFASNAVRNIGTSLGISQPGVVVYEPHPASDQTGSQDRDETRRKMAIPPGAFVVLGCGQVGWRKGVDIFIDAAAQVVDKLHDIYFVWVGGRSQGDKYVAEIDSKLSDLNTDRVIFTGEVADVKGYFAMADLFALSSREDPFPLVCLQAADYSLPIVCFDDSGGMREFVKDGAGRSISPTDAAALANSIVQLYQDRSEAKQLGQNAKKKFEGPFSIDVNAAKILETIEQISQS